MECKKCVKKVISVLDDSNNYETAVESLINESERVTTENIMVDLENVQEGTLYSEPSNILSCHDENSDLEFSSVLQGSVNEDTEMSGEIDRILEMCEEVPAEINISHFDNNIHPSKMRTDSNDDDVMIVDVEYDTNDKKTVSDTCVKIMLDLSELILELDTLYKQSDDSNMHAAIEFSQERIIEVLLANGCSIIEEQRSFDSVLHIPKPFAIVNNGAVIKSYLRQGIMYKGKILLKAIVVIDE